MQGPSNFRPLNGIKSTSGRVLKDNLLFRSDELSCLTADDWKKIEDYNVVAICDLRRADEVEGYETNVPDNLKEKITKYWWEYDAEMVKQMLGMADKIKAAMAPLATASDEEIDKWVQSQYARYGGGFDMCAPHTKAVFEAIIKHAGSGSIIIHCGAGKDRTGFVVASILHCIGVDRETILDDYVITTDNYKLKPPTREHLQPLLVKHGLDELPQRVLDKLCYAYRDAMISALDYLDTTYGSMDGYLTQKVGITEEQKAQIRDILTTEG